MRRFLYEQLSDEPHASPEDVNLCDCPQYRGKVVVYPSAISTYYAPSDLSGIAGLHRERIRATTSWRRGPARYDCVFCEADGDNEGMGRLHIARVRLFFSLRHQDNYYPCALVTWFSPVGDKPCPDTGMWVVEPDIDATGERVMSVIHLDCILRAAHLIGVTGKERVPKGLKPSDSLDVYPSFYVNKYADHHAHEIAF